MGTYHKVIDITGQKFGKLTVISRGPNQKRGQATWNCICDCGGSPPFPVRGAQLRNGRSTSCGCARVDGAMKTAKKRLSKNPALTSARHVFTNEYADGDLSLEDFLRLSQLPCYYCGSSSRNSSMYNRYTTRHNRAKYRSVLDDLSQGNFYYNGLDRIDSSIPHTLSNVVPCCKWCNYAKSNRTLDEFKAWIKQLHEHLFVQKETDSNCLESVSELALVS